MQPSLPESSAPLSKVNISPVSQAKTIVLLKLVPPVWSESKYVTISTVTRVPAGTTYGSGENP
jgi:hypothetical protein